MKSALYRLFSIRPGETTAVSLSLLQAALLGLPRLFTLTVGSALFLERYPAENLPFVYILISMTLPLVGFLHLYCERHMSFIRLHLGTLAALSVVSSSFVVLLHVTDARWPALALFIWYAAEFHLSNIVLWSTANRMFTVRQGKRLFGLIGSGEILTAIIGGTLTPLLCNKLGTSNLLLFALLGLVGSMLNLALITRVCPEPFRQSAPGRVGDRRQREGSVTALLRSRYLRLIFECYALLMAAGFFVNNIFYFQLGQTFSSAAELAAFIGQFFAVFSFLSLVTRAIFSGRLLVRFGILGGLLSSPVALLLSAVFVVGFGSANAAVSLVFWSVILMRLLERLFLGAFGQPAYYTLYQPLSRERRARVQTTAETITGPLAGGITGVVLLLLTKVLGFGAVGLSAALIPLLIAWIAVCFAATNGFRSALASALKRRGLTGSDLIVSDPTSLKILERGLESHRPQEVLYCLRLLEDAEHPRFRQLLTGLYNHHNEIVRAGVYRIAERHVEREHLQLLKHRLEQEEDPKARAALLCALAAAGGAAVLADIDRFVDDEDPAVRMGAIVALMQHCGEQAYQRAHQVLAELAASPHSAERSLAASIIGELGRVELSSFLMSLLQDADLDVRRAALKSVSAIADTQVKSLAIVNLEIPTLRGEALRALLQAGAQTFPAIEHAYRDSTTPRPMRKLFLQIFGRSGPTRACRFLVDELTLEDRGLLSEVLWSLHLCDFSAGDDEIPLVQRCLNQEISHASEVIAAVNDLRDTDEELLNAALLQELEQARHRVFLLLSFLYDADTVMKIQSNFSGSAALRDMALELLETKVSKHHFGAVLPVLTSPDATHELGAAERIRHILFSDYFWTSSWTRACAIEASCTLKVFLSELEWERLLADDDDLVRETAQHQHWRRKLSGLEQAQWEGATPVAERVRTLRGVSIFDQIDDEVLAELALRLEEVHVEAAQVLYREGDLGRCMYIVAEGSISLQVNGESIASIGPGEICGELAALEAEAREESAVALESSHLFVLSDTDLHAFMATRIEVVRGIVAVLCHRVRIAPTDKLAEQKEEDKEAVATIPVSLYGADYLSSLEKVLILKTAQIFTEVADDILTEVAERAEEVRLRKNQVLFEKGDPGTTTYIVAAGLIRIHDKERWIADAGERAVVGELAALSSEPRTASVTAAEDSLLLALDQESLFDLMWDQHEIVRGIIKVLVMRLRRLRRAALGRKVQ